jgi:hypothetical protein
MDRAARVQYWWTINRHWVYRTFFFFLVPSNTHSNTQCVVCCWPFRAVQSSARERESDGPWPFKTLLLVRGVLVFIYVWLEGRECPCLERAPCVNNHDVIRCNLMRGEKDFRRLTSGHSLSLDAISYMRDLCGPDPFPLTHFLLCPTKSPNKGNDRVLLF